MERASSVQEADTIYAKATKAELAQNYDNAFRLYVQATELYLHLGRTNTLGERDKANCKAQAAKALDRAERIKAFVKKTQKKDALKGHPTDTPPTILTPVGINYFSPQEQYYVLKKGSQINGQYFSLWDEKHHAPQNADLQPPLSPEQCKVPVEWRSPEVFCPPTLDEDAQILPQHIIQHVVTDCSVCASISICLEHSRRFESSLGRASLQRIETTTTDQIGCHYYLKLFVNGAWRRVTIDDRLPFNSADGTLMCMSVKRPDSEGDSRGIIWPSLIEKGYMKLMGGYDFPGSNSSVDIHALTGWIPEYVEIKGAYFEREKAWRRILDGFSLGKCILSLGTGPNTNIYWRNFRLLEMHSYAVIDVFERDNFRILTVLDSWINSECDKTSRLLEMPWADVLNVFDGIYISWDPALWATPKVFHGMWKRSDDENTHSSIHAMQLGYTNQNRTTDSEAWILLTRHIVDTHQTKDFISLRAQVQDHFLATSSTASCKYYMTTKGAFTNGVHVLARVNIPAKEPSGTLAIWASYDGPTAEVGFTVAVYLPSGIQSEWNERITTPPFTKKVTGNFTTRNSGGNSAHPTFMLNPQYHLRLYKRQKIVSGSQQQAQVNFVLLSDKDVPVNIAVTWSDRERVTELAGKDVACGSGPYSYGIAQVSKNLSAGDYTVILSTFEPNQTGPYTLKVESSVSFDLTPIPQEGAGMYSKFIRGSWDQFSAGGGPSFGRYSKNPIYELDIQALTQVQVRLQLVDHTAGVSLNVTIFPYSVLESHSAHATSGGYDDSISGVVTPQVALGPGKYCIVPSTYNPGAEGPFQLIVYTSNSNVSITERR